MNIRTADRPDQSGQHGSRIDSRLRRLSEEGVGTGLHWWAEALLVLAFYVVYSWSRNQFGSASVEPSEAQRNALSIIDLEKALGLFQELRIQEWFLDATAFIQFWNLFYGTAHFGVTILALVWLYRRFPVLYPRWRSSLLCTTGLALIGFSLFPLMPPRLLVDCGEFGGCLATYPFVDTLSEVGGLWSFDSGTMQKVSNQYAAMPSLHFAWAMWCTLALLPVLRSQFTRALLVAYPFAPLFAVIVTGNHYWLDAIGGVAVLGAGVLLGRTLADAWHRWSFRST
ncbi:MAG: phosphatase PAP2 family protein [Actinomycetota bacterium]|nr:phosphatase PAP2 family protein [Actinomycetota bacterium]